MKRQLGMWIAGCLLLGLVQASLAAGERTADEFIRLTRSVKESGAQRTGLPPVMSRDAAKEKRIGDLLAVLVEKGAENAQTMCVVDDIAIKSSYGDTEAVEPRLDLRLNLDTTAGRFVAGSELNDSEGLSSSAWFFYKNFFAAYAGLNPGFKRCGSPLAMGVAALAAFNQNYKSDLALLPAFKREAAMALVLLNEDPGLVEAMTVSGPADPALRERVKKALQAVYSDASFADRTAEILLKHSEPIGSFPLRSAIPAPESERDVVWQKVLELVAYPGAISEWGTAIWSGRKPDAATVSQLDSIFAERVVGWIRSDAEARGLAPDAISKKAIVDVGVFPSAFGFVYTYRPEFEVWRGEARGAATTVNEKERDQNRKALISKLSAMLTTGGEKSVAPAANLCAFVASQPMANALGQPAIALDFQEQTLKQRKGDQIEEIKAIASRLALRWQLNRPAFTRGMENEEIVFSGSVMSRAPEGPKVVAPVPVSTTPKPDAKQSSLGDDKDKAGHGEGQKAGRSGLGDGNAGTDGRGKTKAPAKPEITETAGFAPDSLVIWRPARGTNIEERVLSSVCQTGAVATLIAKASTGMGGYDLAWAQVCVADGVPSKGAVRLELENSKTITAGASQEFFISVPGGLVSNSKKKAREIAIGDSLLGKDGNPVKVVKREEIQGNVLLINPSMAVFQNMLVEGVLAQVGVLQDIGGILGDMLVETPSGGSVRLDQARDKELVAGFLEERAGAIPTRLASRKERKVDTYVELRYELEGRERILRIAATQKVAVWLPGTVGLQTYACAEPALLSKAITDALPTPNEGETNVSSIIQLKAGMMLVTAPTGPNQPPGVAMLKSITGIGAKRKAEDTDKTDQGQFATFVPEVMNCSLLRVEGILLHCPSVFEVVKGLATDTLIARPPEGVPPGAPLDWKDKTPLISTSIRVIPCPEGTFVTVPFPEKTWLVDRTAAKSDSKAYRLVKIETARGSLICGNLQLIKAVVSGREVVDVPAEDITHDPQAFGLLFLDCAAPRPDGELERVAVTGADYQYGTTSTELREISGHGYAGRVERTVTNKDGKVETKVILKDIYFANGFMVVAENEESTRGGGSTGGGGGGAGEVAPDESVTEAEEPVEFNLPGINAGGNRTKESRIRFTTDETFRFKESLSSLQSAYGQAKWGRGRLRDLPRFSRFVKLYFPEVPDKALSNHVMNYAEVSTNQMSPAWTDAAFTDYLKYRATLIEHGIPSDLFGWVFRYVFLVTLAYETQNNAWGDALLGDFTMITMTIALGRNDDQATRSENYYNKTYHLSEALLWSRDVVSIIRDGQDGRHAWIASKGWTDLLQSNIPELTESGKESALLNEKGEVEIGNLWIQLQKSKFDEKAPPVNNVTEPELAGTLVDVNQGVDENMALTLITSPSQDAANLFTLSEYTEPPFAGKTIRAVMGMRQSALSR